MAFKLKKSIKILSILLIIIFFFYFFMATTLGFKTLYKTLQFFSGIKSNESLIKGHLFNTVEIYDLKIEHPNFTIDAKELYFTIRLFPLLQKKIAIPYLKIQESTINLPHLLKEPLNIEFLLGSFTINNLKHLESIQIEKITGQYNQKPLIGSLSMKLQNNKIIELLSHINYGQSLLIFEPSPIKEQFTWDLVFFPNEDMSIKAHGILSCPNAFTAFKGEIRQAEIASIYSDAWMLKNPAAFILHKNHLSIAPLEFENDQNIPLFIQMGYYPTLGSHLTLNIPDFKLHSPYVKGNVGIKVALNQMRNKNLTGTFDIHIKPGRAKITLPSSKIYDTRYEGGSIKGILSDDALNIDIAFKERLNNFIEANISMPHFILDEHLETTIKDQPISGNVTAGFQDLSLIYLLADPLSRLKGIIDVHGSLHGKLSKPSFKFNGTLRNSRFSIPKSHISILGYSMDMMGEIPGKVNVSSQGTLGGNPFYFKGYFMPFVEQGDGHFTLTGENIRIYNTANIIIYATPDLKLDIKDHKFYITGNVDIPYAEITAKNEGAHVILSNDVVYKGEIFEENNFESRIIPNIEVTLSKENKVHFVGFGLDATLKGKLRIEQRPDGLYTGLGRLLIKDGTYRLKGSTYKINRGLLLYPTGTLLNDPILDIKITKKRAGYIEDPTEVGFYVQGLLQKPSYQLYSNDDLQTTEILSRLGFGSNEIEGADSQSQLLTQTAQFLSEGASPLIDTLQNKLGLEEFGIQSAESQRVITTQGGYDTVLVVGKSLSDRFYLQFIRGMLEPLNVFRLKYFISPRFAIGLESSSTEDIGGDISFSLEQN